MTPPSLIAPRRRLVVIALLTVALVQGVSAAGSAEAVRLTIAATGDAARKPALIVAGLAIAAGLAVLGERWIGERLAQSYVIDTRKCLFEAVIAQGSAGREARWLTPMVSDLAALRNWAARGPVRLVTATLAGSAASAWFALAWPGQALALLPIAAGLGFILIAARRLDRVIAAQRSQRGALTRFLIRRVRAEIAGDVSPHGHGRKGLALKSAELGRASEQRALQVGVMEAIAVITGALSALILVIIAMNAAAVDKSALIAGLALIGFIATRLLEVARALHAHVGGQVARRRVATLLRNASNGKDING